jgi:general secretion pathway protein J
MAAMKKLTLRMIRPASNGFTLVEVLVALAVMALMAAMAWQGVDAIVRVRDASQQRVDATLRMNMVIGQWEQDLASLQETASVPQLQFDGATLRLTRRAAGGIQLVAWALRADDSGSVLQRWASPAVTTRAELQDIWLRSQQFQGKEAGQLRTLDGLSSWQLYYYRVNAWSNAQSSAEAAEPETAASAPARTDLPSGIRLVLEFADSGANTGNLTRDTLLGP